MKNSINLVKKLILDDRIKNIAKYNFYYLFALIILLGTDKLIIIPFLIRNLMKAEFGVFIIIMTICNVLITALSGGINAVIIREHAKVKNKIRLYNVSISLTLILSSTIIIVLLLIFPIIAKLLKLENYSIYLYPLMIYTLFLSIRETYLTFKRIELQFKFLSIQNIILGLLYLLIIPLFYLLDKYGIALGYLLASLISLIIILKNSSSLKFHFINKDIQIVKIFFKYGPYFMIGSFLGLLMRLIDRFFIAHYINTEQVTVYFTAASTVAILTFPFSQIGSILLPIISNKKEISEFKKSDIKKLLIFSFLSSFIILILGLLFGRLIITLLYGPQFYNLSKYCFLVLLISFSIHSLIQYSKHFIDVFLNPNINLYSVLFAIVINITGNYFLIPLMGILGAAISTGSSLIVYSFIWFSIFMRKVYIKTN